MALIRRRLVNFIILSCVVGIVLHVFFNVLAILFLFVFVFKFYCGLGIVLIIGISVPVVMRIGLCWLLGKSCRIFLLTGSGV